MHDLRTPREEATVSVCVCYRALNRYFFDQVWCLVSTHKAEFGEVDSEMTSGVVLRLLRYSTKTNIVQLGTILFDFEHTFCNPVTNIAPPIFMIQLDQGGDE